MKLFKSIEYRKAENELKEINKLEKVMKKLSDNDLQAKTNEFKENLKNGQTLKDIRVEVFATVREATWRILKKWPFDVQIIGGLIIDYGSIAEMKTGEGKTIASIAPVYLNALTGHGVLVSTVNEYLTERDATEMGEVYNFLGLTVGINKREKSQDEKREAYHCDITYSVHSEVGFDYLRDNMVKRIEEKVQKPFNFALIDEVDSILIDEARTPLIITGGDKSTSSQYLAANTFAKSVQKIDYEIDWEAKSIQLLHSGIDKANNFFAVKNFYDIENSELVHRVQNALRVNYTMTKDVEYIVRDNKIELVDAFTGRVMEGRSYADGLHQAIQAKESVEIEPETKTLATITYQNLFRMFKKLSGMTGTAKTEEEEFIDIYNMRVFQVPTNLPMIRVDKNDKVYVEAKYKYQAIVDEIKLRYKKKQPILLGTQEVSESEKLSKMLSRENIPHKVLNAKQNEAEAETIAIAGELGSITIATNMAGRGTDIKPEKKSLKVGGLYVIGTNKAEARRIDNQLKGRSGRQGDVGESRFFLSLEDPLISRFSNQEKLKKIFKSFGSKPIQGKQIIRALDRAQKKIEGFNYDARKNVLQYDDIIRQQRDLIYAQRDIIIGHTDLINVIERLLASVVNDIINFPNFKHQDGSLDIKKLSISLNQVWFQLVKFKLDYKKLNGLSIPELKEQVINDLKETYLFIREKVVENVGEETLHSMEREILLGTFDDNWQLHIDFMTKLRSSSSLASYAQKNPYQVYVEKGAELFEELLKRISHNAVRILMQNSYARTQVNPEEEILKQQIGNIINKNKK